MVAGIFLLIIIVFYFLKTGNKQAEEDKPEISNSLAVERMRSLLEEDEPRKDIMYLQKVMKLHKLAEASPTTFMLRMRKNCVRNNIPYPTGKVYRGKNGTVYHGFSNGHYGRQKLDDNKQFDGWLFFTYVFLLPLLDTPSAQALEENHQTFIAENGEIAPITDDLGNFITPYTDVYAGHYPDTAAHMSFNDLNNCVLPHVDELPTVTDIARETVEREQHDHGEHGTADDNDTRDFDNYSEDPNRNGSDGSRSGRDYDSSGSDSGGDAGGDTGGGGGFDGGGGSD